MTRLMAPIILAYCCPVAAAPLFDGAAVVDAELRGPVATLMQDREVRDELPFELTAAGATHRIDVRIRGNSRLRMCEFYPLRLDFDKTAATGSPFDGLDKMKLVTHCRNNDRAEQDVLEEYLAYRIFNAITDISYRVRLLRLDYIDSDGKLAAKASPRYGFVIEPDSHLARRLGVRVAELQGVPKRRFDVDHAALVFIFHYLIGNTDWGWVKADNAAACCHNGDVFETDEHVLVVPYDFDLAGLVNTRYAKPDPSLHITRVTHRRYRGLCLEQDALRAGLRHVRERESAILAIVADTPGLGKRSRKTAADYIERFFRLADDEDRLLRSFARRCL